MNKEQTVIIEPTIKTKTSSRTGKMTGRFLRCSEENWTEFRGSASKLDVTMDELIRLCNLILVQLGQPES